MGKLANISGKEAARAFEKAGWQPIGQVGSHLVLVRPAIRVNLSVPQHKELSVATLRALI
jgi:predicted RNA binding protein YcfA (HicA-like mRNA interferase family)